MSLPPAFLDELRQRLTLSDIVGRKVTWDRRKSNPAKGDFWAPCPFHQEKTPSFHVEDRKGFFYCFGCQAKGDMISFVTETENMGFMEAVELLAREAGVEMPARQGGAEAKAQRDRHQRLFDVMEQAVRLYGLAYRSGAGEGARAYAAGRGLSDTTLKRFEIGYAPSDRTHQTAHFREKGVLDDAIAAGLVIKPDDGGAPYDRFRDRLMFPIRDPRGRCIAFGGRALSPEARAKYLNSPETPIFSKGRVLYNHAPAREAAGKAGALLVAEGYMDVIALAQAGLAHAVAPLGTAITPDQLQLLWRMADEPVVALDGDAAGQRAANRLVDLALPLLQPGRSLRFCVLPEGKDPDDLLRAGGVTAMERALDDARPLIEQLWLRETAVPLDTPERRAALDQRLATALQTIADERVRNHYRAEIRERRAALFNPRRDQKAKGQNAPYKPRRGGRFGAPEGPQASTRNSALVRAPAATPAARIREGTILMIACCNPGALGPVESALEAMTIETPAHGSIRDALLALLAEDQAAAPDFAGRLAERLGSDALAMLGKVPQARAHPLARPGQPADKVAEVLTDALARHEAALAWEAERAEAARDLEAADSEDWTWRLRQAGDQLRAADQPEKKAVEPHEEGPSELQKMLDDNPWARPRR